MLRTQIDSGNLGIKGGRIRVLIASRSFVHYGGVVNYVRLLLENLRRDALDYHHVVVGSRRPGSHSLLRPFEYVASVWRFWRALSSFRPDVVHLNPSLSWTSLPLNFVLFLVAKVYARAPVIFFIRGWDEKVYSAIVSSAPVSWIPRVLLRRVDFYAVLGNGFKEKLVSFGIRKERILVTSVMVDVRRFAFRRKFDVSTFRVLFVSRLVKSKGVWILMDAIEHLKSTGRLHGLEFVIAGDGEEKSKLEDWVSSKGLQGKVVFLGYVRGENKYRTYSEAHLLVFPSLHPEGFPNVILEALAAGLPIIYTPMGAIAEVLGQENGICIPVERLNGKSLAEAILLLKGNVRFCEETSLRNRALAETRYDVRVVSGQMEQFYLRVWGGHLQ